MKNHHNPSNLVSILAASTFAVAVIGGTVVAQPVYATVAGFSANDFCKSGGFGYPNCVKENENGEHGSISCPTGKVIQNVYVHAGDGQTVYQLPHTGFSYSFSNGGRTVTVNATSHPHDLSWLGVTCMNPTPTPTPTPSATPTPTPSATPTPTPTPSATPTPTPTIDPCFEESEEPCSTPTPTPTATPVPTATPTSTPSSTPNPDSGKKSKLGYNVACTIDMEVTYDALEDGKGVKDVKVKFKYRGEQKEATTNENGRARVFYSKNGDDTITTEAEKDFPGQSITAKMPENCPVESAPGVGGRGQILGASIDSYAATGSAVSTAMEALAGVSFTLIASGAALYAKTKKA